MTRTIIDILFIFVFLIILDYLGLKFNDWKFWMMLLFFVGYGTFSYLQGEYDGEQEQTKRNTMGE